MCEIKKEIIASPSNFDVMRVELTYSETDI